jgi:SWIM zinc finger
MTNTPQVGTPEQRGVNRWFVPSGTAGVGYWVERLEGRWRCCCPSSQWRRQQLCKHVMAVIQAQRREVQMG